LIKDRRLQGSKISETLRIADVRTITDEDCRRQIGDIITDNMVCQGRNNKSPCNGDSGGPLMMYPNKQQPAYQIGIVSFGPGLCNHPLYPHAVYTQTSKYNDWLEEKVFSYDDTCPGVMVEPPTTAPPTEETTTEAEMTTLTMEPSTAPPSEGEGEATTSAPPSSEGEGESETTTESI
jgi:secreted trypsin-like serine protease